MAIYRPDCGPDATPDSIQVEISRLESEQGRLQFKKWGKNEHEKKREEIIPKIIAMKRIELVIRQREKAKIKDNEENTQKLRVARAEYDIAIAKQNGDTEAVKMHEKDLKEAKELLDTKLPV